SATTIRSSPDPRRPIGACRTSAVTSSRSAPARCTAWHWRNPCLTISREGSSTSIPRKTPTRSTGPYGRIWSAVGWPCARARSFQRSSLSYMALLTMVFTTYLFVFYFLPLVLVFYYAMNGLSRQAGASDGRTCLVLNTFLLVASYIFYGWWNPWFIS